MSGVNHQELAIAVDLTVATREIRDKPDQVKAPDAAELRIVDSIIEIFDLRITVVEVLQPLLYGSGIVHAIEIPALNGLEVLVVCGYRIETPVAAVRKNVFVCVRAGDVVRCANGDDVKEKLSVRLQERSQFPERLRQVPHMAENTDRQDLVELLRKLRVVEVAFHQGESA